LLKHLASLFSDIFQQKLWRTFEWKLITSALLVVYDDGEICRIDIPSRFAVTSLEHPQDALSLLKIDKWRDIRFDKQDQVTVALTVNLFSNSIIQSLVSFTEGDSFSSNPGIFDHTSLQDLPLERANPSAVRCFGNMWVAQEGSKTLSFWTAQNQLWRKYRNDVTLEGSVSQILAVDEDIGLFVVRDREDTVVEGFPSRIPICAYWIG
jgi:hypothetical protein